MKFSKRKSIIAVIVSALIILVLGICAIASGTRKEDNNTGFKGTYDLNAFADTTIKQVTVSNKLVDIVDTVKINSTNGEYTLCLTVIDVADLTGLSGIRLGYEIGEGLYFHGSEESGLSNVVYSSLTLGSDSLAATDLGLDQETFAQPYFIVVEVPANNLLDKIFNCIIAPTHSTQRVEGQSSTCTENGWKDYYVCTDEGCNKYFSDSLGIKEITDLDAWKTGAGMLELAAHTEVIDKAVAPTCTEDGLTAGSHCSVCGTVIIAQQVDPATGHTVVTIPAEDPNCTESGLTAGSYCSVCGEILVAQENVNATGHTEVIDEAIAPTCTETGFTQGSHCSTCGDTIVAQTVIPALGHTYLDGYEDEYCTVCHDHKEVVKDVDGVNYTLNYSIDEESGAISRYFIATGKADEFNSLYTGESAQTLILANEVGIKHVSDETSTLMVSVTEVGESAFANTDGNPIKSVIIPKNIVTVGTLAFHNNVDMQSVVFLAPEVFVRGTYYNNSDGNTTPFYGCYTSSDKEETALNVYYTAIKYGDSTEDLGWARVYQYSSGLLHYRFYIAYGSETWGQYDRTAHGSRITSGWSYVNLTVNNNTGDSYDFDSIANTYVTEGVVAKVYDADKICVSVQSDLDVLSTTQEKCLKYVASVEISKDDFGTTQVVVNVDLAKTTYYLLTLSSATTADDGSAVGGITKTGGNCVDYDEEDYYATKVTLTVDEETGYKFAKYESKGDYVTYNEATYAANVTLTADEVTGYKFANYLSNGVEVTDNPYTFTLDAPYDVSVYYEATTVTINVISAVEFSHHGTDYASSATGVNCIIDKDNVNVLPTAEGYLFLGWAKVVNESLEFTTISTQNGVTYYAIWASNATLTNATPTTLGTLPSSESLTVNEGTFYGWYNVSDTTFTTQVTSISVENTVLYARMQYTVSITGTVTSSYYSKEIYINNTKQESYSLTVLEGCEIYINEQETNKVYTIYQYNQDSDDTMLVNEMRIKTKNSWTSSNTTKDITVSLNGNTVTAFGADTRFKVSGSISININY